MDFEAYGITDPDLLEGRLKETVQDILNSDSMIVICKALYDFGTGSGKNQVIYQKGHHYVTALSVAEVMNEIVFEREGKYVFESTKLFKEKLNRYRGDDLTNKSLLIWRTGGIGDLMFIQPVVAYLRDKYPSANIVMGTAHNNIQTLALWPSHLLDGAFLLPFDAELLDTFDYHLMFEGTIERCREAQTVNCYDLFQQVAGVKFNPQSFPIKIVPNPQIVQQLSGVIRPNTIAIQSRSTSPTRSLSHYKCTELFDILITEGYTVGLLDSGSNAPLLKEFIKKFAGDFGDKVYNLATFSPSLSYCASILSLCKGAIAVDSAINHLAAGVGTPTVGLFGPFRGDLRMRYYTKSTWVDPEKVNCPKFPCFFHGHELMQCPYVSNGIHPACMDAVDLQAAVKKLMKLI